MQNLKDYKLPKNLSLKSNLLKIAIWRIIGFPLLASFLPGTYWRKILLRKFGAKIGKRGRIKPYVRVTYPWKIEIGNDCWIGEEVWLDSVDFIKIGNNVCISQRAYLCTGNHNYNLLNFDLITKPIIINDGCWVGACSIVSPGSELGVNSVVTIGSLIKGVIKKNSIYMGNPAKLLKERKFNYK